MNLSELLTTENRDNGGGTATKRSLYLDTPDEPQHLQNKMTGWKEIQNLLKRRNTIYRISQGANQVLGWPHFKQFSLPKRNQMTPICASRRRRLTLGTENLSQSQSLLRWKQIFSKRFCLWNISKRSETEFPCNLDSLILTNVLTMLCLASLLFGSNIKFFYYLFCYLEISYKLS